MPATASRARASEISILRPATTALPSPPTVNCPVRSRWSLILLSMYSFRSSLFGSAFIKSEDFGKLSSFGRSCFSTAWRAGSCDRINVVFVVRGVCWESEPAVTPTRNCRAAGLDVKNDKSRSFRGTVAGVFASPSFFATAVVVRIERSWAIMASLRAFSCFRARFSFLVSWSFLRGVRSDSGVGSSGERVNCRFYKASA